ncbi:MAG TPA: hypothetical protein VF298_05180 [Bacteroidales bacterium]
MKKDTLENRMSLANNRFKIPDSKLLTGSLIGKYPVILDGGRTIIFISDKSKESETRRKYELRKDNKVLFYSKKPKT